jgi:hypothetical protein
MSLVIGNIVISFETPVIPAEAKKRRLTPPELQITLSNQPLVLDPIRHLLFYPGGRKEARMIFTHQQCRNLVVIPNESIGPAGRKNRRSTTVNYR